MGAPWPLCEGRLVQSRGDVSAANADTIFLTGSCPAGKVWVILAASYMPSVAETQLVSFEKINSSGYTFTVLNPLSMALNPSRATFIEQGMEYFLLPGEYIQARRAAHTAGSTMNTFVEWVEIDLPLYVYDEPQVVKRQDRAMSSLRQRLGGGSPAGVRPPSDLGGERGGRTGPLPK